MRRSFQNRSIEVLEDKRMMAANLIGSGMAAMPMAAHAVHSSANAGGAATTTAAPTQNVSGATHLSGVLSGTGQGIVNLVSKTVNGATNAKLMVHVTGAPADATLNVSIGDTVVGTLSTNAQGNGVLHLNSKSGNADQLLSALSNLSANANVSVGIAGQTPVLTGTLQAGAHVGENGGSVSDTISGLTQAVNTLENSVISKLNSIIDNLNANGGNGGAALGATTDRINNLVDRLSGLVGRLTPSAVDSALGDMDLSSLVGSVHGLVPSDVTGQV